MIYRFWIRGLQFASIFLMWMFAAGVLSLIVWLVLVAARWQDALNWTLAISLVMAPVYLTVAGTLTYVFIGLQRGAPKDGSGHQGTKTPP
jgi:cation transport ATPase